MHTRVVALAVVLSSSTAGADTLSATRAQPMFEASHTVDIKIADGVATYTVRRMFSNPGTIADQVELRLDLPYGAAATGLRIRANNRWYDGVLMEREAAEALYREMTGFGSAQPKDPALLAWSWADKLSLQVFPVMPNTVSTVEYTLTAPTRYEGGRYFVSYPRVGAAGGSDDEAAPAGLPLATPVVTVHPSWGDARTAVIVDGKRVARDTPVVLLPPIRHAWEDQLDVDPSASYVASTLEVPAEARTKRTFTTATLDLELAHTFKGDLRVELLTPRGERVAVHEQSGGGDNDLRGKRTIALPAGTQAAGTWRLVVSDHAALDTGTLDRWSITFGRGKDATTVAATDTPLFVPDAPESASDAGVATISIAPPPIKVWEARYGVATASAKHAFARLEVDVAPQLVPTPRRAQVVFALDTSYTQGEAGVAAQLDVVRAYLSHVPDAELEIVTYRRRAERVFGRFVPAADVADALAVARHRGAFALGNGSALDEGARLAVAALADRKGPRRIVLVTDELVRSSLAPALALASLASLSAETVVHVVVPGLGEDDRVQLARRDTAPLAPLATRHHGIYVDLEGLPASPKALAPAVLELVRPTRIEGLAVTGGFKLARDVLVEGDGVRLMIDAPGAPARITLTGRLWSDPVKKDLAVGRRFSSQTAAFVFGADEHHALTPDEMMKVALLGRAVSPVTSYVAAEPGVRPSTIGLAEAFGSIGSGSYGTIGHGAGGGGYGRVKPDLRRLIETSACVAQVRPSAAWTATLKVETTRDEIVEIVPSAGAMAACLAETAWSLRLDASVFHLEREDFVVELAGAAAP